MLSAEQLQMKLPIHVSNPEAGQLLWSVSRVHFHCAIINVHGSVTQLTCEVHFQLRNRLSWVSTLLFSVRSNELRLENEVPTLSWKLYMNILQPKIQVIIICNVRLIYYPGTPILNPLHTPTKIIVRCNHRLLYMLCIIMLYRL